MTAIPEEYMDIISSKALASFATIMADGSPQVTPVWFSFDGALIWVNSAEGRVKDKNVRRTRKVALAILDVNNPYRHIAVRGEVVEITNEGADDHIDRLAKKYLDQDTYPFRQEGEVRVIYKIRPYGVATMG